jgi:hypothetical protein
MAKNQRHVVRNPAGGWDVKKPHAERSSAHLPTQAEADRRAAEILRNAGGGERVTHDRQGQIRSKDTIGPSHDPYPPLDKEH